MHMKATITGKDLAVGIAIPAATWEAIGNELKVRIVNRTRYKHVDADGKAFEPYSEGYAKAKAKRGGMIGGGAVNLTGVRAGARMLDDITVLSVSGTTNPRLRVGFALAEKDQLARYHMGEGRVDRLFFGLDETDKDYAVNFVRKRLGMTT